MTCRPIRRTCPLVIRKSLSVMIKPIRCPVLGGTVPSGRRGSLAPLSKAFRMLKHLVSLNNRLAQFRSDDRGLTSVEYGLMVALIAVAIIGSVIPLGANPTTLFTDVA